MYTTLPNGVEVFYREAGPKDAPVILLLHGFPTSSNQYRNLIPLLSHKYHVIAPDLPGFGFTKVPAELKFAYTFANIASTISAFLDAHSITKYSVYIFDYGAPTGLRLALQRPHAIQAIITQNGNAYEEGLSSFWEPLREYQRTGSAEVREAIRAAALTPDAVRAQYEDGERPAVVRDVIDPAAYTLDAALLARPGNADIQLDLFYDYQTNVALYPQFQAYFRDSKVPLLAVWGENDPFFLPAGAKAYKRDLPDAEVHLLDAGHFAVESHTAEIATLTLDFLAKKGI